MFQYSSTSRNCRNRRTSPHPLAQRGFQYSSTSRNCRNLFRQTSPASAYTVSVLFNESKLPKSIAVEISTDNTTWSFSTLQRVEIAEIHQLPPELPSRRRVSALFNESKLPKSDEGGVVVRRCESFSTLQRVEIAEIRSRRTTLLLPLRFSTLQRVEIAEMTKDGKSKFFDAKFQYSSTSRNCRN